MKSINTDELNTLINTVLAKVIDKIIFDLRIIENMPEFTSNYKIIFKLIVKGNFNQTSY